MFHVIGWSIPIVTLKLHFLNDARNDGGVSQVDDCEKSTTEVKTFPGYGALETSKRL